MMLCSTVAHFFGDAAEGLVEVFGVHVVGPSVGWEVTMVDVGCVARREEYFSLQG